MERFLWCVRWDNESAEYIYENVICWLFHVQKNVRDVVYNYIVDVERKE